MLLLAAALPAALILRAAPAAASGFNARLYAGPGYMSTNSSSDASDASGPALLTQLDAGVQVLPQLSLNATLLYDYSNWLELDQLQRRYPGSMLGAGLGATLTLGSFCAGAAAGVQSTQFTSAEDPSSGPNGASVGPFISAQVGYLFALGLGTSLGVHGLARYRSSKDETNSVVYDPDGYQLGLVVSLGFAD